jgi:quercetin dioxygenase-like cupin family protein
MKPTEKKSLNSPDETRTFPKGKVEIVTVGGVTFGRATLDPGWKWSEHVKPIAKTKSCEAAHTLYQISGHLHVRMDDGSEFDLGPGDVAVVAPGHDAWVVGNEPVVELDVTGMVDYAKQS